MKVCGGSVAEIKRIDPPLPLETPKGKAFAHFLIDYGMEHHIYWVCFVESTGECWTFDNTKIKMQGNPTVHSEPKPSCTHDWVKRRHISRFYYHCSKCLAEESYV